MISGYFMMRSIYKENEREPSRKLGESTIKFLAHKYAAVLYYIIPSAIFGYIAYIWILPRNNISLFNDFFLILFEIIPLQNIGFPGFFTTGTMWYISALFIAMALLYPICKKYGETASMAICPILSLVLYGLIAHNLHTLDCPDTWLFNIVSSGLFRSLAGVSAGCFLYEFTTRFVVKDLTIGKKVLFTILEMIGYAFFLYIMIVAHHTPLDFVSVFILFGLIIIGINRYSYFTGWLNFNWSKYLADYCIALYLNHFYWKRIIDVCYQDIARNQQLLLLFTLTFVTATLTYLIVDITRKSIANRKKIA